MNKSILSWSLGSQFQYKAWGWGCLLFKFYSPFFYRLGSFEIKTRCCGNHDIPYFLWYFFFLFPPNRFHTVLCESFFSVFFFTKLYRGKWKPFYLTPNIYSEMTFVERLLKGFEFVMKLPIFPFFSFVLFVYSFVRLLHSNAIAIS